MEEYTVNDFIDESVAEAPDLSYLLSDFDDKGYSDVKGAITDEAIVVGTQQLEKIQREGEAIIADINSQIQAIQILIPIPIQMIQILQISNKYDGKG